MSPIRIDPVQDKPSTSPWLQHGMTANPFPPSGVATDVDYDEHQPEVVERVNSWLGRTVNRDTRSWSPLAVSGSIGVGKTHVLRKIERACREYRDAQGLGAKLMVSSHTLTSAGMKSLMLSNLLLEGLSQPLPNPPAIPPESALPFVALLVEEIRDRGVGDALDQLPQPSPIHPLFRRILEAKTDEEAWELAGLASAWISRRTISAAGMERLGVPGKLDSEGQAIRAFAHLCRLGQSLLGFRVWLVLIDQLEDLWRRDLTTPLRRTRFLTDLRTLIDEALEGAPVALTLAWNTEITVGGARISEDIESRLRHDYVALFSRVRDVVRVPTLPAEHALPFALAYVTRAQQEFRSVPRGEADDVVITRQRKFAQRLQRDVEEIRNAVAQHGTRPDGSLVARYWLEALRMWAENQVK